jgi:hypothetical protein
METPPGFLVLTKDRREVKAITPDEARLWVREFDDPHEATLAFWGETLRNELVKNRGYVLIGERRVSDQAGREGLELLLETTSQGQAHRYLVTVFVVEGRIRVGELVAPKAVFDRYVEDVRKALATLSG